MSNTPLQDARDSLVQSGRENNDGNYHNALWDLYDCLAAILVHLGQPISPVFRKKPPTGFALVELVLVVLIIGLLASLAVTWSMRAIDSAKLATAKVAIRITGDGLEGFYADLGHYPDALAELPLFREVGEPGDFDYSKLGDNPGGNEGRGARRAGGDEAPLAPEGLIATGYDLRTAPSPLCQSCGPDGSRVEYLWKTEGGPFVVVSAPSLTSPNAGESGSIPALCLSKPTPEWCLP